MPTITQDQFESVLRAEKLGSLYLFDGPEAWLKERMVKRIVEKLFPQGGMDFNLEKFDGTLSTGAEVAASAHSLPFLAERRVLVVQSTEEFGSADSKVIADSLAALPQTTCLVFLYAGKASVREEIPAMVTTHGAVVTFWTPFPNQLPKWVIAESRRRGKPMDYQAAEALSESCADLQQISNELDKLFLFVGKKSSLTLQDVMDHGLPDDSGDQKKLEEAILFRDLEKALHQGRLLMVLGIRPEVILPTMERLFRNILLAHFYRQEQQMGQEEVVRTLKIRGLTQQSNFRRGVEAYSRQEAEEAIRKITEADFQIKTGSLTGDVGLSLLLLTVINKKEVYA